MVIPVLLPLLVADHIYCVQHFFDGDASRAARVGFSLESRPVHVADENKSIFSARRVNQPVLLNLLQPCSWFVRRFFLAKSWL